MNTSVKMRRGKEIRASGTCSSVCEYMKVGERMVFVVAYEAHVKVGMARVHSVKTTVLSHARQRRPAKSTA